MSEYKISSRYATSLLETAEGKKMLDAVAKDIELISSTLEANHQLILILSNPVIKPNVKLVILEEIFKSRITPETSNFLRFLIEKNRENLLESISKIFLDLRDDRLGIVNVEVKTAVAFTEDQVQTFKNNLEKYLNKKIRIIFKIDPEIIGGFIVNVSDTMFDASLKHQLELLKKQFLMVSGSSN
ncbi:MAG: ATP synthase F1 subunit delta [Bacteroidetes bacterium]|nr:ATP synthase F1 subunit delta [Bacteroidota bacterium]